MLARWSGWGSLPALFDEADETHASDRERLRALLSDDAAWAAARRTTLNAHYTSAEVVQPIWQAIRDLGFTEGRVLEPGCGSGNFIGFAPPGAEITGVEADSTTARIAQHLYGAVAEIRPGRFEAYSPGDGCFDLVVGNVPFAKVTPHDPKHNRGRHALHNYFILKSLDLVRPGGLVVVITSRYTLDASNPAARREMAEIADLVGAVRLPAGSFWEAAGTQVVCDVLALRRRPTEAVGSGPPWIKAVPADIADAGSDEQLLINEYFVARPDQVLGELTADRGMYRERELTVRPNGPLDAALTSGLDRIVADGRESDLVHAPATEPTRAPKPTAIPGELGGSQEGTLVLAGDGFAQVVNGALQSFSPRYRKDEGELRRLIGLRDAARSVLDAQIEGGDEVHLREVQSHLADAYGAYLRLYGPINRYTTARTGRIDAETGEEVRRRVRPRMGGFRDDPDWPLVAALEVFDDTTQAATPSAIFTERVVSPPLDRLAVDTPAEAVAASLDELGRVELTRVAELLGCDLESARDGLQGLVFDDPATGELIPSSQYLSGNVRQKLEAARAAGNGDPRWADNVAALQQVLPRQLEPGEITAGLGAPWIAAEEVEAFCSEVLGAEVVVERLAGLGRWSTALRMGRRGSVSLSSEWGTARADAITLLDASLNQRLHTVTDETEDGRRIRNDAETIAARDKQEAMASRFAEWVWEDPARAHRLAERYNELFSSTVVPVHDGSHLSLPGLAETFRPHSHQRDAVARVLTDGRALLAHAVGAGKTATMVMAAMELRRLKSAAKPAIVVPNHMLEQFTREWLQLYPTARVLVADKARLSRERRKEFVARCATGDWDGIIFTQSGFGRLPLGGDLLAGYLSEELERSRAALAESQSGKGLSVKRLERRIAQLEETYQRLLAAETKDDGVRFEETGIDYLFVDEAHLFKNRRVDSAIEGMAHAGSQRAQDLDAKLWVLRRNHGPRVATFATATPVANSIAELWTMQSYLQPDVLAEVELTPFDSWAATFGRTVTALELAPDGSSYRMQTRFARFQNIPELLTLYRQVADVRTTEDLDLPVPELDGGQPATVVVPASESLTTYVAELAARAERVRNRSVDSTEDNMLKITGDGRRAALDLRLVGEPPDPDGGKVAAAADRISAVYRRSLGHMYRDGLGDQHGRSGALQLVFCDASTPSGDGWNAYGELRDLLVARDVPAEMIRFIHEAGSDEAKARLFEACRDGRVAVLVGSTDKMGIGTNVQARAIALHHLDCPWRPADIEQREGRILRQGNQNPQVEVVRYATEGSFDIYMWQTVERKATFINQVATGRATDREVEDIGDQALSYAEVKALATGDPLILEKASVDSEVARLSRLERSHRDDQYRLRRALEAAERQVATAGHRIEQLERALATRTDTRGDKFSMVVDGERFTTRVDAGARLVELGAEQLGQVASGSSKDLEAGAFAGFPLEMRVDRQIEDEVRFTLADTGIEVWIAAKDLCKADPAGLVSRLERRVQGLDGQLDTVREDAAAALVEAERAKARLGVPFDHADDLARLRHRQTEIADALFPDPAASAGAGVEVANDDAAAMAGRLEHANHGTERVAPSL